MSDLVGELNKVIQDIRSLLISAPNGLTPSMLEKDYKEVVGREFPHRKFGYFNCLEFVRTLHETVHISMRGGVPILFGVADKNTEHILKMVQKQKKSKLYSKLSGQQNQPISRKKPSCVQSSHPSAYMQSGILKVLQRYPNGVSISKLHALYEEVNDTFLDIKNVESIPSVIMQMPEIATLEFGRKDLSGNNLYIHPSKDLVFHKNLLKSKLKLGDTAKLLKENKLFSTTISTLTSYTAPITVKTSTSSSVSSTFSTNSTNFSVSEKKNSVKQQDLRSGIKRSVQGKNELLSTQDSFNKLALNPSKSINSKNHLSQKQTTPLKKRCCGSGDFKVTSPFEPITPPSVALLQEEIVEMLGEYTNGICSIDVPTVYEKKFHKELDLHKHGYYSIVEFIVSMTDRVHMCRLSRNGDWLLKLRSSMATQGSDSVSIKSGQSNVDLSKIKADIKELAKKYKGGIVIRSLEDVYEMNFDRQLPLQELGFNSVAELMCIVTDRVDIVNDELCLRASSCSAKPPEPLLPSPPVDAIGRGICYRPPNIPLKEWGFFDCFVSHVCSPEDFTIQVMSDETTKALDRLMDEMEKVYNHPNAKEYRMPPHMAKTGQICVVLYHGDNNWNRAVITSDPQSGFVEVTYVDYGGVASISVESLYLMKSKFLLLPALRIRCRLAHLKPPDLENWSPETKRVMLGVCKNKPMVAEVVGTDDHDVVSILLCDTSQDDVDVYLNDLLLDKRLAIYVPDDATQDHLNFVRANIEMKKREESRRLGLLSDSTSDIPQESPPPYQETDTLHNGGDVSDADTIRQLEITAEPPVSAGNKSPSSVSNPAQLQELNNRISLFRNRTTLSGRMTASDAVRLHNTESSIESASFSSRQQKRFLKSYRLNNDLPIHVVNYEGNALVASGEISSLFRPKARDLLVPMLLLKDLQFTELTLANVDQHVKLFDELKAEQVKGAYSPGGVKSSVTLYPLNDVPAILDGLEHNDKTSLKKEFAKIILSFDPEDPYWFSNGPTISVNVGGIDISCMNKPVRFPSVNPPTSSTSFPNSRQECSYSSIEIERNNTNKPVIQSVGDQTQTLLRKKEEILQELIKTKSSSQKSALLKSLTEVLGQLGMFDHTADTSKDSGIEPMSKDDNDEGKYSSNDICAIPSERDSYSRLTNIFSESNLLGRKAVDSRQPLPRNTYG